MQYYLQGYDPGGGQLGEIDLAFFFFFLQIITMTVERVRN